MLRTVRSEDVVRERLEVKGTPELGGFLIGTSSLLPSPILITSTSSASRQSNLLSSWPFTYCSYHRWAPEHLSLPRLSSPVSFVHVSFWPRLKLSCAHPDSLISSTRPFGNQSATSKSPIFPTCISRIFCPLICSNGNLVLPGDCAVASPAALTW